MQKLTLTILALALAACAGSPARDDKDADARKRTSETAATTPNCPTETGSHIRREPKRGLNCQGPGMVVDREQLLRTGSPSLRDALRSTVPSLQ